MSCPVQAAAGVQIKNTRFCLSQQHCTAPLKACPALGPTTQCRLRYHLPQQQQVSAGMLSLRNLRSETMHTFSAVLGGLPAEAARQRLLRSAIMPAARRARVSASRYTWRFRRVVTLQIHTLAACIGPLVWGSVQVQMRAVAASRTIMVWYQMIRSHIRPAQHSQRHLSDMHVAGQPFPPNLSYGGM